MNEKKQFFCGDSGIVLDMWEAPVESSPNEREDRHFPTDRFVADLKRRSLRGGAVTMAAQGVQ